MTDTLTVKGFNQLSEDECTEINGGFWSTFFAFVAGVSACVTLAKLSYDFGKEIGSDFYKITH